MTDEKLSLPEKAVMITLMAEAREVSNPELKQRYGLTLDGRSRTRLNDLRYVSSRRHGRAFAHLLEERGWAWCVGHLGAELPPRSGSAAGALYAVLANLPRHLDRAGLSLADVFHRAEDVPAPAPAGSVPTPRTAPAPAADDAEARIRTAYADLAGTPGTWVSLTRIRADVDDLPRADVDRALRHMYRLPDVHIVPESNQKSLSTADRAAAVIIGDQEKHLLAIGNR
ncbi:hypothetical protein [Polymorphospora sp. NPDC050346]|uniref:hypothetical protein n=1 Tax=Polymorphospora sp. NPDC050346 TaxID=3155780 RepID=UPI0033D9892A